jgi:uridine kinase
LDALLLSLAQGITEYQEEESFYKWLAGKIKQGTHVQGIISEYMETRATLSSISLIDGGNSPNSASNVAEALLRQAKDAGTLTPPPGMPVLQALELDKVPMFDDLQKIIPKGYKFFTALGRTLVFYSENNNKYLAVKLLKEGEDIALLDYESRMLDYINTHSETFGLKGQYPSGYKKDGHRVLKVIAINGKAKEELNRQVSKDGSSFDLDLKDGCYKLIMYQAEGKEYFRYLSDAGLTLEEFRRGVLTNIHDLFSLARHGIIHTALIELFHNLIQRGRQDRGMYLWMVDIIRPMVTRSGAGRLHAWTDAVKYPNMRLSGIADFPEFYLLEDLVNEDNPVSRHMAILRQEHAAYDSEVFYLASYMGDYLLSAALVAGRYFRERDLFDWNDPDKVNEVAEIMRSCYLSAFCAFTGRRQEEISGIAEAIDWNRLAMQMAFFMAKGDKYANHLLNKNIPQEIYGPDVKVGYQDDYRTSRGWISNDQRNGWYFDAQNPDLGPVNGPNPLQELIKANYLFSAFMVLQNNRGSDQSFSPEKGKQLPANAAGARLAIAHDISPKTSSGGRDVGFISEPIDEYDDIAFENVLNNIKNEKIVDGLSARSKIIELCESTMESKAKISVLAIDGNSGTYKSTAGNDIKNEIERRGGKAVLISRDWFIDSRRIRYARQNAGMRESRAVLNDDDISLRFDKFREDVLDKLVEFRTSDQDTLMLQLRGLYNSDTGEIDMSRNIVIGRGTLIIIEGNYLLSEKMRKYFDKGILMLAKPSVGISRRIIRDTHPDKERIRMVFWHINTPSFIDYMRNRLVTPDLVIVTDAMDTWPIDGLEKKLAVQPKLGFSAKALKSPKPNSGLVDRIIHEMGSMSPISTMSIDAIPAATSVHNLSPALMAAIESAA